MDKHWQRSHVVLLDGASWHMSNDTSWTLTRLKIPHIISGPYSYDAAPIELYFAAIKRGNMNPDNLPTSKSKFISYLLILVEYL